MTVLAWVAAGTALALVAVRSVPPPRGRWFRLAFYDASGGCGDRHCVFCCRCAPCIADRARMAGG